MESQIRKEPSIKAFIKYLLERTDKINEEIFENKRLYEDSRAQLKNLENWNQEKCNEITNSMLDEVEKIERNLKSLVSEEKADCSFIKQQISAVTQEKMKLEQNILLLGSRVEECERNIGIDLALPVIKKENH